jgi:hypothetical protein
VNPITRLRIIWNTPRIIKRIHEDFTALEIDVMLLSMRHEAMSNVVDASADCVEELVKDSNEFDHDLEILEGKLTTCATTSKTKFARWLAQTVSQNKGEDVRHRAGRKPRGRFQRRPGTTYIAWSQKEKIPWTSPSSAPRSHPFAPPCRRP